MRRGCDVRGSAAEGSLLLHDCDATKGDSGSPLLLAGEGGYRLVAIHVATLQQGGRTLGVAVPASAFADPISRDIDRRRKTGSQN